MTDTTSTGSQEAAIITDTDDSGDTGDTGGHVVKSESSEGGASKPVTFSDLDDVIFESKAQKPTKQKKAKEETDDDEDDDLGDIDSDGIDDELADIEDDLDDAEEDGEEETEEAEQAEDDEKDDESGEESEDDSKLHEVKVNGKLRKYTLKQMKDLVSSGAHLEQARTEFRQEMDRSKRDFETSIKKLEHANGQIKPIIEALDKGDVQTAILESARFKGMTKVQAKWKLADDMLPLFTKVLGLDPAFVQQRIKEMRPHIDQMMIRDENEFLREEREKPAPQAKEDSEAEQEVQNFMDEMDLSRPQLRKVVSWLKDNTHKGKEDSITLDVVRETVTLRRAIDKAFEAIGAVRPSLRGNKKFLDRVIQAAKSKPDITVDRLARWVDKQARRTSKDQQSAEVNELRKDVSRKVLKSNNQAALKKASPDSQKKPRTFADLTGDGSSLDI